ARFVELYQVRIERERDARETVGLVATVLAGAIGDIETESPSRIDIENALASALPPRATAEGRRIYVADADGTVIATAPRDPDRENLSLTSILGEAQPLTTFGARAGVMEISLADGTPSLATVHHAGRGLGSVVVVMPTAGVYDK